MLLNGAAVIIECLKEQKVNTVFGYPGGTILTVYDEMYKHSNEIQHILTTHEQGAAHAADGYARSTGKTGVCMVTSGPGATNLVTGIATAYMDSVPLVALTINVPVTSLGKDSFQEVDIAGITMPVTKHNFIVKDVEELAGTIRRAFHIASAGRPGPVLVDITKNVTTAECEYEPFCIENLVQKETVENEEYKANLDKAVKLLKRAKKPVILVGGGACISGAQDDLMELLSKYETPVIDTLMGKGVCPGDNKVYMGMAGIHGTKTANYCISQADVILAVGTRFSERVTAVSPVFAEKAEIIQIDIDRAELNKNVMTSCSLVGDAKKVLNDLTKQLKEKCLHESWINELNRLRETENTEDSAKAEGLTGQQVVEEVYKAVGSDAIITTEVGQNQMLAARHYTFTRPRTLITSGGLGTMGYGLGAAIGAQIGNPKRKVVNFAGDGCFRMNMGELLTAVSNKLPILEIIFDNHSLGMVYQMQTVECAGRHSQTELSDNADYVMISRAMGADAYRVSSRAELAELLSGIIPVKRTTVIECVTDINELV